MKIDLYQLRREFHFTNFLYPIILDVLKIWAESVGWKTRIDICSESKVNFSTDADVVGISVFTQTAPAAFRVSDKLRKRGKIVILGGPHFRGPATFEEAAAHCDIVVSSICKSQWTHLLRQIAKGSISPIGNKSLFVVDKERQFRYPNNFYDTLKSKKWYQVPTIPTSIGCPYDCSFCSPYLKGHYILREIQTIVNEVSQIRGKVMFFADATFGLKKKFTIALMKALAPMKKMIGIETSLMRLQDAEILDAMAAGGVKWIIVGIETLSKTLKKHGATDLRKTLQYTVRQVHRRGMFIQGNFICGLDCDGPGSFDDISWLCKNINLDSIMVGILTPYPNTRIYEQMLRKGRIIDTNWAHYDYSHIVYRPLKMTIDQLIDGLIQLYEELLNSKLFIKDTLRLYSNSDIRKESSVVVANNAYFSMDAKRKIKAFRKNRQLIKRFMA
ncbi:MAG: B12-binding domain-containing radical SAM protein [Nitrospinales bacterium]